ncbi:ATP-binding protein [Streptomyces sp. NPDC091271]|uniref:ATP-binding protein n=1 Tax=Streptomyces sp. NPDC091271 TaxID=3365980 RepID=UPI0037FB4AD5
MSMWWSLHLRREAASVPLARRFLLGTMETAGVDPDISYDLSVALSEACANAVEHGGGLRDAAEAGDAGPAALGGGQPGRACGQYRVTAYLDGEKCRIEVADSGPGFPSRRTLRTAAQSPASRPTGDPSYARTAVHPPVTAESGRGLCLIEELADHVHFGNRPGHGAVVSFDKVLKWREGALLMVS